MYNYHINHVVVLEHAHHVREAYATYNKWCKTCDDHDLSADVFKCVAQFNALAELLRLRPKQLWAVVRALERVGYGFTNQSAHPRYFRDSARLFNQAFENAKK